MNLEINLMVSTWLNDPTFGADAMLSTIPREAGDAIPGDFATITSEMEDDDVARDEVPGEFPSVSVSLDVVDDEDGHVQVVTAEGDAQLRIRVALKNAQSADGRRELSYRMRAVVRSFRLLMTQAHVANRKRNGIFLVDCLKIKRAIVNATGQQGSDLIVGYIIPTIHVEDLNPFS